MGCETEGCENEGCETEGCKIEEHVNEILCSNTQIGNAATNDWLVL